MELSKQKISPADITKLAEEAYIFAYPILENLKTMDRMNRKNVKLDDRSAFNILKHNKIGRAHV